MKPKLFLVILISFSSLFSYAQGDKVKIFLDAASAGFKEYLEKIPNGQEPFYGFNNRNEFALAKIGKPYQIFTLSKDFFADTNLSDKENYLVATEEWRVSINVNGESRILLTVAKMNGVYQTVGIGASALAKELGEFEKKYSSPNLEGKLLRVYQLECDLFITSAFKVYPLTSAQIALGKTNKNMSSYSLLQALLVIKNNIDNK
jgi:hypothetical protein